VSIHLSFQRLCPLHPLLFSSRVVKEDSGEERVLFEGCDVTVHETVVHVSVMVVLLFGSRRGKSVFRRDEFETHRKGEVKRKGLV
jgi:hypothetical protein